MMAAGAPKRDRQIALALANVVWNQIDQQFGDPIHKFDRLRKRSDVPRDIGMAAGELLELRNVVRVRKKAHVENQIAVSGNSVAITETGDVDSDLRFFAIAPKGVLDRTPELVHVEFRRVDDVIRHGPDGRQLFPLGLNALRYRRSDSQGMRPARFTEPPHQGAIVSFEKKQSGRDAPPRPIEDGRELIQSVAV